MTRGEMVSRARKRVKEFVREQKRNRPCADCFMIFPYYVMQFDHRPGEVKCFDVSCSWKVGAGIKRVSAEIAKCDLVCANCHAERTNSRNVEPFSLWDIRAKERLGCWKIRYARV